MIGTATLVGVIGLSVRAASTPTAAECDLNGDGYAEFISTSDWVPVNGESNAGEIYVWYGTTSGLPNDYNEIWNQATPGVPGTPSKGDGFGWDFTCGNFDGDDYDDVAIGVPGEEVTGFDGAGSVYVIHGSSSGLDSSNDQVWHQNQPGVSGTADWNENFGDAVIAGDFDGDGYDDLAIGVVGEDVGAAFDAGAVNVVYGSAAGLTSAKEEIWSQDSPGVKGQSKSRESFGTNFDVGDFDGDGHDDLVIGVPWEDIGGVDGAGAVNVIYGSSDGLDAAHDDYWYQDQTGIKESSADQEQFGARTGVGDLNGDGYDDLAIGVPDEDRAGSRDGVIHVIFGTDNGLKASTDELWHQNRKGVKDVSENNDALGSDLTIGDFDGDGFADLAMGVPGEDIPNVADAGVVNVVYGSPSGLDGSRDDLWHQNQSGVLSDANLGEGFGGGLETDDYDGDGLSELAVHVRHVEGLQGYGPYLHVLQGRSGGMTSSGDQYFDLPDARAGALAPPPQRRCDLNGDSYMDLVVSNEWAVVAGRHAAGEVYVRYGSAGGLPTAYDQAWNQGSGGVKGSIASFDRFGSALACGDFDGDGYDDLAIGAVGDDSSGVSGGAVNVLYGSGDGLSTAGDEIWHREQSGVKSEAHDGDGFGTSVATGDFDGDGHDDLAIGSPWEDQGGMDDAGGVNVIYGSVNGLNASNDDYWHQDKSGVTNKAESNDWFGFSVNTGDFDGDGFDDLTIGVPKEDIGGFSNTDTGALHVLYGTSSGLGAADDDFWHQDQTGIKEKADGHEDFGSETATGDFNGDGYDDLAVGVESEDLATDQDGVVHVIYGSNTGLDASTDELWHQDRKGIKDEAEPYDFFGSSVAVGDFNDDGRDDLAVGAAGEEFDPDPLNNTDDGVINVIYGSPSGLSAAKDDLWYLDKPGVEGVAGAGDFLGKAVSVSDFDGDGYADLVGFTGGLWTQFDPSDRMSAIYGSSDGLLSTGTQYLGIPGPGPR